MVKICCTFLVIIIIIISYSFFPVYYVIGASPSISLQGIDNTQHHWHLEKKGIFFGQDSAKNITQCSTRRGHFPLPQIAAVNYISSGKTLNATLWLDSPFQEPTASPIVLKEASLVEHDSFACLVYSDREEEYVKSHQTIT